MTVAQLVALADVENGVSMVESDRGTGLDLMALSKMAVR